MSPEVERIKKLIESVDSDKIIGVILDGRMRIYYNFKERFDYNKHIREDIECLVVQDIDTNENSYTLYTPIKYIESFLVSNDKPVQVFDTRYIFG